MINKRFALGLLALTLGGAVGAPYCVAETLGTNTPVESVRKSTNSFRLLAPGPSDSQIALATAVVLQRYHYLRQPFDSAVSSRFFDRYLNMFDPQHMHFLQADIAGFERFRSNLDQLTLVPRGADTRPAFEIYNRFIQRLKERVTYMKEVLNTETFTFDTDEQILLNRKEAPYPKDMQEARALWRQRVRYEYLDEKLGKIAAKKKPARKDVSATNAPPSVADAGKPKKTEHEEIVESLSRRYQNSLNMFKDWDSEDVLQVYLTALAHVYDPHSDYFSPPQMDSFAIQMNLSLFGIGAELRVEDGYCVINKLMPGGPAIKSKKLAEKDRIIAVAQSNQPPVDIIDMNLNKAVQLIRGPKGTEVRLTIIPAGSDSSTRKEISLVRDEIPLEDAAAKGKIIELPDSDGNKLRLGVIDLPSFYANFDIANTRGKSEPKSPTADVAKLLTKFKEENVRGVILDLRRNGGGSLEEAIKLTGLFIKEGPVVQVRAYNGTIQQEVDPDPSVFYDGPLMVLTSRFSASASEILAGALQDYGRALIVGDSSTHGKGTVQMVQPLKDIMRPGLIPSTNDPGDLKLTIKKFYRASGASTQLKGVVPDVVLPSVLNESKEVGERALENPLEWDTIPSAKYTRLNLVEPYLPELRLRSSNRLATDKEYSYIREDIELYKKNHARKTISLNEKDRLKEKEELDARIKAREKERKARVATQEQQETVYEISLKQALLPGLPAPVGKTNAVVAKTAESPATGTNDASAFREQGGDTALGLPGDDDAEDKAPVVDASLSESERLMLDYISLLPKNGIAAARN